EIDAHSEGDPEFKTFSIGEIPAGGEASECDLQLRLHVEAERGPAEEIEARGFRERNVRNTKDGKLEVIELERQLLFALLTVRAFLEIKSFDPQPEALREIRQH